MGIFWLFSVIAFFQCSGKNVQKLFPKILSLPDMYLNNDRQKPKIDNLLLFKCSIVTVTFNRGFVDHVSYEC
jgi:hypothetical protein